MFLLDGKLLGIGIMKLSKTRGQSQAIVPADEVAKLIPQIPTDTGEK